MKLHFQSRFLRATPVVALLAFACLFASGCTSMQSVGLPSSPPNAAHVAPAVKVGDFVQVQTKDGHWTHFNITAIDPDGLVGRDGKAVAKVKYDDMTSLQVRHDETADKALKIVEIILLAPLVLLACSGPVY